VANAHQVVNRSDAPCTYLVVGSRGPVQNVTHYPDRGDILYDFDAGTWRPQRVDGTLIKEGRLTLIEGGKRVGNFLEIPFHALR
jgi:uncharacterized cupin superfamily protein